MSPNIHISILHGFPPFHTGGPSAILPRDGQRQAHHLRRAGGLQHPDALRQRCAGGEDVVNEQQSLTPEGCRRGGGGVPDACRHAGGRLTTRRYGTAGNRAEWKCEYLMTTGKPYCKKKDLSV